MTVEDIIDIPMTTGSIMQCEALVKNLGGQLKELPWYVSSDELVNMHFYDRVLPLKAQTAEL